MVLAGFGWCWFMFVCGQSYLFVGGGLHFLGGHGFVCIGCHFVDVVRGLVECGMTWCCHIVIVVGACSGGWLCSSNVGGS